MGYAELVGATRRTQEEVDAVEKIEKIFRDAEFEDTTGMPSVAQQFKPADEL